jgi:hypothetical protein
MHPQPFPRKPMTNDKPARWTRFAGVLALPAPDPGALQFEKRSFVILSFVILSFVIRDPSCVMSARRPSVLKDSIA